MLLFLKSGKEREAGWLRREEAAARNKTIPEGKQRVHLDPDEKELFMGAHQKMPPSRNFSPTADLAHAFGVKKTQVRECLDRNESLNASNKRKERSDAGETLFNSDSRQESVWTARQYHAKRERIVNRGDALTKDEIKLRFETLSEEERNQCESGAKRMRTMMVHIDKHIGDALQRTNGSVSWETIAILVAGGANRVQPVSKNTIAKYVMSTYGAQYTSTKTVPTMNERNKQQCYQWAKAFILFWEGAKLVAQKVQILNIHQDEKWFYCLVIRSHNKWVPYFGVTPNHHSQHTKNSANKVLCISCVGFVPKDNNPISGGEGILIDISRAGHMVIAQKDTYKRVYNDDMTYTMPAIPENRLRVKGEQYFENLEITGSKRFKKGKAKFPLLNHWDDTLLPKLDNRCAELTVRLNKKIVV
jgi:hypothetical protein